MEPYLVDPRRAYQLDPFFHLWRRHKVSLQEPNQVDKKSFTPLDKTLFCNLLVILSRSITTDLSRITINNTVTPSHGQGGQKYSECMEISSPPSLCCYCSCVLRLNTVKACCTEHGASNTYRPSIHHNAFPASVVLVYMITRLLFSNAAKRALHRGPNWVFST